MRVEQIGNCTLYNADCLEVLPTLEGVDAVVTDPPYSSGGQFRGDRVGRETSQKYTMTGTQVVRPEFAGDNRDQRSFGYWGALWLGACLRASNPGAVACLFTDWRQLPTTTDYMQAGGWVWRGIVPWDKQNYRPQMGRFAAQCEYVVWGTAGGMPVERGVGCLPGLVSHQVLQADKHHITGKPTSLMREIVEIVPEGATVLDLFMGSGTTGVACVKLGRKFIGIELEPKYFDIACKRIEDAYKQPDMFIEQPQQPKQEAML